MMEKLGLALLVLVAYLLYRRKTQRKTLKFDLCLETREKHGADPVHGRLVQLSSIESGILKISQERKGAMRVCTVLRLKGPPINRDIFAMAVRGLQIKHPILRCVLRKYVDRNEFYMQEDLEKEVEVIWVKRVDDSTMQKIWEEEAYEKPPVGSIPMKLYVLEGPGISEILFFMDHFFCDGLSIVNLFKELLTLLKHYDDQDKGKEEVSRKNVTKLIGPSLCWQRPMENSIKRSFSNVFAQWSGVVHFLLRYMLFEPPILDFPIQDKSITAHTIFDKCKCNPYFMDIGPDIVKPLLKECKKNGITIGAAIAASFLYACRETVAEHADDAKESLGKDIRIPLAVDLRRRYADPIDVEHLGYNVSSCRAYKCNLEDAFKEGKVTKNLLLKRAKDMAADYKKFDYVGLVFGSILTGYFDRPPSFDHASTLAITNWGRINLEPTWGRWEVDNIYGFLNMVHFRMPTIITSTFNNKLHLTIVVTESACSKDAALRFLDLSKEYLCMMGQQG